MWLYGLLPILFSFPSAKADGFHCSGAGYSYSATAPTAWVLDNNPDQHGGLCLVGYPRGKTWENSDVVLYINPTEKEGADGSRSLKQMMAFDVEKFKKSGPKTEVRNGPEISAGDKKIPSKFFYNRAKDGNFEIVAYDDRPQTVFFLVMTARSEKALEASMPAFKEFVQNYKYSTSSSLTENKSDNLEFLIKLAQKDKETTAGKKYDDEVMKVIGDRVTEGMRTCTLKPVPITKFNNIFVVNKEGLVTSKAFTSDSVVSRCLDKELTGVKFPKPPFEPFHWNLEMSVKE